MRSDVYLTFVDITSSSSTKSGETQSNKFYNMFDNRDGTFTVKYGRVGSSETTKDYPISKWESILQSKIRKGYKDISDLKAVNIVVAGASGNKDFDDFYKIFSKYTGNSVKNTYLVEGCSQGQIDEAQAILDKITKLKKIDTINENLKELYRVIPRRMPDVRQFLINKKDEISKVISREQDALDSMSSSNIIHTSNPFKELDIDFVEVGAKQMEDLLYPTMGKTTRTGSRSAKIHKVYQIVDKKRTKQFDTWVSKQKNKACQLLIHGTRCPNVFSILKTGLLIRPTNAASFAGSVYGDGIYHSAHSAKSLGYVGYDPDKLFFIQNVHMGNHYTYSGWYRDGKDLSRNEMNYKSLQKRGYDSLYVKAGDGLLNSEYIVYNSEQSNTNFLVWMK